MTLAAVVVACSLARCGDLRGIEEDCIDVARCEQGAAFIRCPGDQPTRARCSRQRCVWVQGGRPCGYHARFEVEDCACVGSSCPSDPSYTRRFVRAYGGRPWVVEREHNLAVVIDSKLPKAEVSVQCHDCRRVSFDDQICTATEMVVERASYDTQIVRLVANEHWVLEIEINGRTGRARACQQQRFDSTLCSSRSPRCADAGTLTLNRAPDANAWTLWGRFDLYFGGEHISGAFPDTTGGPTSPRCVAPWRCICIEAFELSCATRRVTFGCVDQPQSVEVPPTLGECWGRVVDPLSNCERPQINTKCRRNMPCVPPDGSAIGRRCRVDTDCPDGYFCIARGAPLLGGGCATACSAVDPSCPVAHATCTRGVRLGAAAASGLYCVDARAAP
ncbi:MAG: hypothetical protein KC503_31520 [Myxococcales bacterium]|nr:hypothetical protein [Myxococcales bacterium]